MNPEMIEDGRSPERQAQARGEAIYRAIAQSFPEGAIYVFDHDLRYLIVEGELLGTLGQTREGLERDWKGRRSGKLSTRIRSRSSSRVTGAYWPASHCTSRHGTARSTRTASFRQTTARSAAKMAGFWRACSSRET